MVVAIKPCPASKGVHPIAEGELNATDLNARAMNELNLVDLDVAVFKAQYCSAMSQIKQIGLKYQLMFEVMTFDHKDLNTTALLSNAPILVNTNNALGILLMLRNRHHPNEDEHPMIPHYHDRV
jgi:hypothetical protein